VESAQHRGVKPAARLFATSVPTVSKWLRGFQQHGPSGLQERSRARHRQPLKTPVTLEAPLIELRKTLPSFGARRIRGKAGSAATKNWRKKSPTYCLKPSTFYMILFLTIRYYFCYPVTTESGTCEGA
jgi:helix-turn-helix protein